MTQAGRLLLPDHSAECVKLSYNIVVTLRSQTWSSLRLGIAGLLSLHGAITHLALGRIPSHSTLQPAASLKPSPPFLHVSLFLCFLPTLLSCRDLLFPGLISPGKNALDQIAIAYFRHPLPHFLAFPMRLVRHMLGPLLVTALTLDSSSAHVLAVTQYSLHPRPLHGSTR